MRLLVPGPCLFGNEFGDDSRGPFWLMVVLRGNSETRKQEAGAADGRRQEQEAGAGGRYNFPRLAFLFCWLALLNAL
jgi:hypothetical protein